MIARLRVLTERLEGSRARLLIRVLFITTAITFTLLPFLRFLHSGTDMDYRTWFDAGQTVLRGDEIYPHAQNFPFMYPPTCALLLAAPAFFGKPAMILILSSLNTMAWILCIRFSSALMSEQRAQNAQRLGLNSDRAALAEKLPGQGIEFKIAETQPSAAAAVHSEILWLL